MTKEFQARLAFLSPEGYVSVAMMRANELGNMAHDAERVARANGDEEGADMWLEFAKEMLTVLTAARDGALKAFAMADSNIQVVPGSAMPEE